MEKDIKGYHDYNFKGVMDSTGKLLSDDAKKDIVTMGMEIEFEFEDGSYYEGRDVDFYCDDDDETFVLAEDCSLSNGFELVSEPMPVAELKEWALNNEALAELFDRKIDGTETNGVHIHVGSRYFQERDHNIDIKMLLFFFLHKSSLRDVTRNSSYARFPLSDYTRDMNNKTKKDLRSDDLEKIKDGLLQLVHRTASNRGALNLIHSSRKTFEFRLFQVPDNVEMLGNFIDFTNNILQDLMEMTVHQVIHADFEINSDFEYELTVPDTTNEALELYLSDGDTSEHVEQECNDGSYEYIKPYFNHFGVASIIQSYDIQRKRAWISDNCKLFKENQKTNQLITINYLDGTSKVIDQKISGDEYLLKLSAKKTTRKLTKVLFEARGNDFDTRCSTLRDFIERFFGVITHTNCTKSTYVHFILDLRNQQVYHVTEQGTTIDRMGLSSTFFFMLALL